MKLFTQTIVFILFSSLVNAQIDQINQSFNTTSEELNSDNLMMNPNVYSSESGPLSNSRAFGDTINGMYWDFAGGFPLDWTRADLSAMQIGGWQHTTQKPQGIFSTDIPIIQSTTKNNGFMILDGDFYNIIDANEGTFNTFNLKAFMQTPVLDLSEHTNIKLHFQTHFRFFGNATSMQIFISKDGGTTFNDSISFKEGLRSGFRSFNALNLNYNISNIAGGQANVVIRFQVSNASHYYWMIDDVAITEAFENDMVLTSKKADFSYTDGGYYTQIPYTQLDEIFFSGSAFNNGSKQQTGVKLNVKVNKDQEELFNASSTTLIFNPLAKLDYTIAESYKPTESGLHRFTYTIEQDQEEQYPSDNISDNFTIFVSDSVYARDDGIIEFEREDGVIEQVSRVSTSLYANNGGDVDDSVIATLFNCKKTGKIKSISIYIARDTLAHGTSFKAVVFKGKVVPPLNNIENIVPVLESDIIDINDASDTGKWLHIPFITDGEAEIIPQGGADYLVGIQCFGIGEPNNNRRISVGSEFRTKQPQKTSSVYAFGSSTWGFIDPDNVGQPMIRLNLADSTTNIKSLTHNFFKLEQNIPNPTSNETRIEYFLSDFTSVNLSIIDITGKSVYSENLGNKPQGKHQVNLNLSDLSNGIYFYTLRTKFGEQTKRMIIAK